MTESKRENMSKSNCSHFCGLISETTFHYFCHALLEMNYTSQPTLKGRDYGRSINTTRSLGAMLGAAFSNNLDIIQTLIDSQLYYSILYVLSKCSLLLPECPLSIA